jgi:hypothetical protein
MTIKTRCQKKINIGLKPVYAILKTFLLQTSNQKDYVQIGREERRSGQNAQQMEHHQRQYQEFNLRATEASPLVPRQAANLPQHQHRQHRQQQQLMLVLVMLHLQPHQHLQQQQLMLVLVMLSNLSRRLQGRICRLTAVSSGQDPQQQRMEHHQRQCQLLLLLQVLRRQQIRRGSRHNISTRKGCIRVQPLALELELVLMVLNSLLPRVLLPRSRPAGLAARRQAYPAITACEQ